MSIFYPNPSSCSQPPPHAYHFPPPTPYMILLLLPPHVPHGPLPLMYLLHSRLLLFVKIAIVIPTPHIYRLRLSELMGLLLLQFSQFHLDVRIYVIGYVHSVHDLRHHIETPLCILQILLLPIIWGPYSGTSVFPHQISHHPTGSLGVRICVVHSLIVVVVTIVIFLDVILAVSVSSPQFIRTTILVHGSDIAAFTSSQYRFGYAYISIHTIIPW